MSDEDERREDRSGEDRSAVVRCSFCQKNLAHCRYLVKAPKAGICDECVTLSLEILLEANVLSRLAVLRLLF